jgi:hypothetical protein
MSIRLIFAATLAALAPLGCSSPVQLVPGPGTARVPQLPDAAEIVQSGVRIVVQAEAWKGAIGIDDHVTPMRVQIENTSARPVKVQYANLALQAPGDARYPALPVYEIRGSIDAPVLVPGYAPAAPGYVSKGFLLAPWYKPIVPDRPIYSGEWPWDPLYHQNMMRAWVKVGLPTPEMRELAMPEGVIQPGGTVGGFLYFRKVDPRVPGVVFAATLTDAETGAPFVQVGIPFSAR